MVKADARLTPLTLIDVQLRQLMAVDDADEYANQADTTFELITEYQNLATEDPDVKLANELQELPDFDHRDELSDLASRCAQRISTISGE